MIWDYDAISYHVDWVSGKLVCRMGSREQNPAYAEGSPRGSIPGGFPALLPVTV